MGKETTIALVAFLACHAALILDIVSLSTNEWTVTEIKTVNNTETTNTTCTKGLWQICCTEEGGKGEDCEGIDEAQQGPKHKAVQGLYVTGTGSIAIGLVLFYVFLLGSRLNTSVMLASTIVCMEWLSTILVLAALILHGLTYTDNDDIPADTLKEELGWSYWVAVAGGAVTFIAGAIGIRHIVVMKSRRAGYQDI